MDHSDDGATVVTTRQERSWTLTFNQPHRRNVINKRMMGAVHRGFDRAEADPDCRVIILEGKGGFFCTGMDFEESVKQDVLNRAGNDTYEVPDDGATGAESFKSNEYMDMLKRFTVSPKVVLAKVDGMTMAGGVGIAAASDLVVATPVSQFSLSEALWGLLPACVAPFLIRRVGFQPAYRMTLTTEKITAEGAKGIGLVDIVSEKPDEAIRRQLLRLSRLTDETVLNLKTYFRKMWLIDENMEQIAAFESSRLANLPRVRQNIRNYVENNQFPWNSNL